MSSILVDQRSSPELVKMIPTLHPVNSLRWRIRIMGVMQRKAKKPKPAAAHNNAVVGKFCIN
jgi:hypothetical protein